MEIIDFRKRRFVQVTRDVIDKDAELTKPVDIAVYTVLCMYASNDSKGANPSMKTIAKKARCSESVARRSVKNLTNAGYVNVIKRSNGKGSQLSNQYVLMDVDL